MVQTSRFIHLFQRYIGNLTGVLLQVKNRIARIDYRRQVERARDETNCSECYTYSLIVRRCHAL
jgi:hypothetical protein